MRSFLLSSFLVGLCVASSPEDVLAGAGEGESEGLTFDWDSHVQFLGLEKNNITTDGEVGKDGCAQACAILQHVLPAHEFDPSTTAAYKAKSSFWSNQQGEVTPRCFVQPSSAAEVAIVIQAIERAQCPFAVKSGGHAAFAGASNVADGVTIDLSLLNEVTVSSDSTTTRVGAGNRWVDVYAVLDPLNLSVVGGRDAEVGVGGLMLGGGLSFFSGRHGWAMDCVRNYELVTAGGRILNVNLESHPDLYWALRGGGNNFGVVTRFDLETFPQGPMWGGNFITDLTQKDTLVQAFSDFTINAASDVDAQAFVVLGWFAARETWFTSTQLTHASPTWTEAGEIEYPAIFANFSTIPSLAQTLRRANMTDLTREINGGSPNGLRDSYWTWTLAADAELMAFSMNVFEEEVEAIKNTPALITALVYQQVSEAVIAPFTRNGGNALGIEESDGPLFLTNLNFMWLNAEDDEAIMGVGRRVWERSVAEAKRRGKHHRYIYQNYAAAEQRVFEGYGEENVARLREVSLQIDPSQTFQKLQPGYFKLFWE